MAKIKGVRKTLFLWLLSVGIFLVPSGCGRQMEEPETLPELEIMLRLDDSFRLEDNAYVGELERRLGIRLKIRTVPFNSYNEHLSVVMASENPPDIIQMNWNGEELFSSWALQGKLLPIDLDAAENISMNLSEAQVSLMKVGGDGGVYGVPGRTSVDYYGVVVRQDWLDALGLEEPETLEEYHEVMQQFVTGDPDGDFKDNTVAMTSWKLNNFCGVFGGAFQTDYLWNSVHGDVAANSGLPVLREQQQGYMPMMDYIRQLYEEGLLDRDFETLQNAEVRFLQGKIGMIGAYTQDTLVLEEKLRKVEPDARLTWLLPPGDSEGRVWNFMPEPYGYAGAGSLYGKNAVFAITNGADYELALWFLDQMNSPEMILFSNLGVQGIHYEEYDANRRTIKRTMEQSQATGMELFGISDTYRSEPYVFISDNEAESERLDYYWRKGSLLISSPQCYSIGISTVSTNFLQQNPFFRETERNSAIAYVTGKMTREAYMAYLEKSIEARSYVLSDIREKYSKLVDGK